MRHLLTASAILFCASCAAAEDTPDAAAPSPGFADRMYAFDCGALDAPDMSFWTPGENQGEPIHLAANCYLIQHGNDYMLWNTGIADSLTGTSLTTHGITLSRAEALAQDLEEVGVAPGQIDFVGVSHTHPDHTGNLAMFPDAMLLIQDAEVEWSAGAGFFELDSERKAQLLTGDHDVFGDGSVTVLFTPGHTPGHQSLLVRLPSTGYVLLTGDVAHIAHNYYNDIVPSLNIEPENTVASIERIKALAEEHDALVLINHDAKQSGEVRRPPEFYD